MIPLRDIHPTRRLPIITISLIATNVLVFLYQVSLDDRALNQLILSAGMIPHQVTHNFGLAVGRDLLTSMFLHGGWMHLLSNMLYLWIFGDNIEDVLGRVRFLGFYVVCGISASLVQVLSEPNAEIPMVGASGAIAGVLGAYLILFPHARIQSLVFFFYFIRFVEIPAIVVLGFWFVTQFFNGLASLGVSEMVGIAYFAHVGGFVAGVALILPFRNRRPPRPPRRRYHIRPNVFQDEFPDLWE
jgi:membrane associated rhomboid family serine protease